MPVLHIDSSTVSVSHYQPRTLRTSLSGLGLFTEDAFSWKRQQEDCLHHAHNVCVAIYFERVTRARVCVDSWSTSDVGQLELQLSADVQNRKYIFTEVKGQHDYYFFTMRLNIEQNLLLQSSSTVSHIAPGKHSLPPDNECLKIYSAVNKPPPSLI